VRAAASVPVLAPHCGYHFIAVRFTAAPEDQKKHRRQPYGHGQQDLGDELGVQRQLPTLHSPHPRRVCASLTTAAAKTFTAASAADAYALGSRTVGLAGQWMMTLAGMWSGWDKTMVIASELVSWPLASSVIWTWNSRFLVVGFLALVGCARPGPLLPLAAQCIESIGGERAALSRACDPGSRL